MVGVPGDSTGGSAQLVKLIDEHGPALIGDFEHHYHRDLRDVVRPGSGLTPRYVLWLAGQLPDGSAYTASLRGGAKHQPWTLENHLLAATVNLLFVANRQRARKPTRKMPVVPPKPSRRQRSGRVVRIGNLPSARKTAGD